MFRFQYDIETIINLLISVPKDAVLIIPSLICTLAMVFYLDWQCAVFALLVSPLVYVPFYYFARKTHRILSQLYENSEQVYQILEETLSHIYLIKAFGREKKEIRSYLSALVTMIRLSYKNIGLRIASNFSAEGVNKLSLGLIALFGGFQVMRGRISLGSLAAIMVYLTQLIMLQTRCLSFFQQLVSGIFSCRRIEDLLRTPVDDRTLQCGRPFKNTCIQFSKVDFQYTPAREIIAQLDMRMESGYVALVGPSGCGKTTIINLILGLYKPQHGTITVGGYTTHDILPVSSRGEISVALQEPYLHNDTILNNIRYAKTDAGMEEIRRIACAAGVEEFVRKLDKGYETRVGENACKFSEGQKQKISIARALLPRPKILILDEAMSSMDSLSEERIIANIRAFNIPLVIFVSHRLSTVMMADVVYYLKSPSEIIVQKPRDAVHADQSFKSLFAAQNLAGG